MTLHLAIPKEIAESVRGKLVGTLEQKAKEDLATQWYREGLITSGQVGEMLGIPWFEAQRLLRDRNAEQSLSLQEIKADADSLEELRKT